VVDQQAGGTARIGFRRKLDPGARSEHGGGFGGERRGEGWADAIRVSVAQETAFAQCALERGIRFGPDVAAGKGGEVTGLG